MDVRAPSSGTTALIEVIIFSKHLLQILMVLVCKRKGY